MFCPGHLSDLAQNCKTADLSNIPGFISPPQSSASLPFFLFLCCFCMITVPYSIYEVQTMDFQTLNFAQVLSERERSGLHHGSEAQPGPVPNCIPLQTVFTSEVNPYLWGKHGLNVLHLMDTNMHLIFCTPLRYPAK